MTSLRKLAVSLTALGCVGLLGCSSGGDTPAAPALPPAAASTSPSTDASASSTPTGTPAPAPTPAPGGATAPTGVPPAPGQAPNTAPAPNNAPTPNNAPAPNGAPGQPPVGPQPPAVAPNPANPGALPPAALGDPAQAVAAAGPKGQTYLQSLHDRGITANPALDGIYVLFGQAVCSAKARGTARSDILGQFSQIGPMLAPGTSLPPGQISEVFVSSAEQTLC